MDWTLVEEKLQLVARPSVWRCHEPRVHSMSDTTMLEALRILLLDATRAILVSTCEAPAQTVRRVSRLIPVNRVDRRPSLSHGLRLRSQPSVRTTTIRGCRFRLRVPGPRRCPKNSDRSLLRCRAVVRLEFSVRVEGPVLRCRRILRSPPRAGMSDRTRV